MGRLRFTNPLSLRFNNLLVVLLLTCPPVSHAQDINALKAAYIFNFSKFVNWTSVGNDIVVCLDTDNKAIAQQLKSLEGKTVNKKPLRIRSVDPRSDAELSRHCNVLYSDRRLDTVVSDLKGVLVVTETRQPHGIISFVVENGKLAFEIDVGRADDQGVSISSRLLQLARKVYQ